MDTRGTYHSEAAQKTTDFGRMVGEWLKEKTSGIPLKSYVILLDGELGSGKTTFTQGLAVALAFCFATYCKNTSADS